MGEVVGDFHFVFGEDDEGEVAGWVEGVGPFGVGVDVGAGEGFEEGDKVGDFLGGEVEVLSVASAASGEAAIKAGDGGDIVVVVDDVGEGGKGAVVHEGAVGNSCGSDHIAEGGGAGNGGVGAASEIADDAVIPGVGIDIEGGGAVANGASGSGSGRGEEEVFAVVFGGSEVGEIDVVVVYLATTFIVFGVEGLDGADKLGEGVLDACFGDGGVIEDGGEEDVVFVDGGEAGDEVGEVGVVEGAGEAHFDVVLDGLGGLVFEGVGAFVPEEVVFVGEAGVDEAHGVAAGDSGDAGALEVEVAEGVFLLVARGAGDGGVAGEAFVVEEDAAEGGAEVGDGVVGGGVVTAGGGDVGGDGLVGVVFELGEVEDSVLGYEACGECEEWCETGFHDDPISRRPSSGLMWGKGVFCED